MKIQSGVAVLTALVALSACSAVGRATPGTTRAVMMTMDGAGARILGDALHSGHMPNLAALRARGAWATHSVTNFPSKTAAGHAALWTGAMSGANGVTANRVFALPRRAHSILELDDGFGSEALLAEPIWVTAARAGKRALVVQATHVSPLATYEPGGRFGGPFKGSLTLLDGYASAEIPDDIYRSTASEWQLARGWANLPVGKGHVERPLKIEDATWWGLLYDDPQDPVQGYDTLAVAPDKLSPRALLKPGQWSAAQSFSCARGAGSVLFHLFELSPDRQRFLLYRTGFSQPVSNKLEAIQTWYGGDTPFIEGGPARLWAQGRFGPTVFQGGKGEAEDRYLTVVERILAMAVTRTQRLMDRPDWDLAVSYLPFPDETLHRWYGALDRGSPSYLPGAATVLRPRLNRLFRMLDRVLGPLAAAPDTLLALASDHGMAGVKWHFAPNYVLREAGLLVLDRQGRVDLSRTKAFYPATDGAFIVVNEAAYAKGIVPPAEVSVVVKRAERALSRVRDAEGRPIVTAMWRKGDPVLNGLGVGGERAGHLYLDLQPGYYFDSAVAPTSLLRAAEPGSGGHMFDPRRPDMRAMMLLAGPGVRTGVELAPVSHADLAPTVAHLLGIPAPAQATGRLLIDALKRLE